MILVTGNENKWREACRILGRELERRKIDLPELQAETTAEVALEKAKAAFALLHKAVVVEDAGIELDAFGTFPGPFIKFWESLGGLTSICRAVDGPANRGVTAVCVLAVCTSEGEAFTVEGRARGTIAESPRGTNGFGWDAIFVPDGDSRTFGEMSSDEKDVFSHRRRAWEALAVRLSRSVP